MRSLCQCHYISIISGIQDKDGYMRSRIILVVNPAWFQRLDLMIREVMSHSTLYSKFYSLRICY